MQWLRRSDANSIYNVRPATMSPPITGQQTAKRKLRGKIFSREDIFAGGYFRGKIFSREDISRSSRENISNSLFAQLSSRENKVLYSRPYSFLVACAHVGISFGIVRCMHLVHKLTTSYTTQSIATFTSVVIKSNNFRITRLRDYFSPPYFLQLCVIIPLIGRRSHCAMGSIVLINPTKINQPRSSTPVYQ